MEWPLLMSCWAWLASYTTSSGLRWSFSSKTASEGTMLIGDCLMWIFLATRCISSQWSGPDKPHEFHSFTNVAVYQCIAVFWTDVRPRTTASILWKVPQHEQKVKLCLFSGFLPANKIFPGYEQTSLDLFILCSDGGLSRERNYGWYQWDQNAKELPSEANYPGI